jgi:hypothetical protein
MQWRNKTKANTYKIEVMLATIATCTPILVAALFTTAKLWNQSRCSLMDEWIKKMRCIYTMKY